MDIGTAALWFVMAFVVGYNIGKTRAENIEDEEEYVDEIQYKDDATDEIISSRNVIDIIIEEDSGWFYVYNYHTSEFMAQGKTKSDVENALVYRYPTKLFNATEENLEELGL
jgi:hypothetical protein